MHNDTNPTMENHLPLLGWREWVALPELNVGQLKVKVDTGARSSALHAEMVEQYQKDGKDWLKFSVRPEQKEDGLIIECHAPVKDYRLVRDSGGHQQRRYVIETTLVFGCHAVQAEITLTDRDAMRFRMLLGRTAIKSRFLVDPSASYLQGKPVLSQ